MEAADLLAEIIAQQRPVAAKAFSSNAHFESLMEAGFIDESGVARSVLCDDCQTPHDAELVFENNQYGIHCPELGFIPRERCDVTAIQPDLRRLVSNIAHDLGCKRCKFTPIHGETWRIGVITGPVTDVIMYFHPALRDGYDLQALQDALSRETRTQFGVVITATGALKVPPFHTVLLKECLTFDASKKLFGVSMDLPMVSGAPVKNKGGRPSLFAAKLKKTIAENNASATAVLGVNEEARAVRAAYQAAYPDEPAPSIPTIKRHMSKG